MRVLVIKFGGSSLATPSHIRQTVSHIISCVHQGYHPVVVVSAMAGQTDFLLDLMKQVCEDKIPDGDSQDMVVMTGEVVSAGLVSGALTAHGHKAQALGGWQVPLRTTEHAGRALIQGLDPGLLLSLIDQGVIPIVAGFQGVTQEGRITTLGRGGSDVTAVALAVALQAEACWFFKDVPGILNADPKIIPTAQVLAELELQDMLELSSSGAKVIHPRAVAAALTHQMPLSIKPTFHKGAGTQIVPHAHFKERQLVTGLVVSKGEVKFILTGCPVTPRVVSDLCTLLSSKNITLDMLVQKGSGREDDLMLTVSAIDGQITQTSLLEIQSVLGFKTLEKQDRLSKISVVGVGLKSQAFIIQRIFHTLAVNGISAHGLSCSEVRVSVLVATDYVQHAAQALYRAFDLERIHNEPSTEADAERAA